MKRGFQLLMDTVVLLLVPSYPPVRTRKRRTRSYDCSKAFGDGQDSDWEVGDRSLGSASEQFRKSSFPSTLCGAPSIYDSKLVAVR